MKEKFEAIVIQNKKCRMQPGQFEIVEVNFLKGLDLECYNSTS